MTKETLLLLNKDTVVWNWDNDKSINNQKLLPSIVRSFESLGFKLSKETLELLITEKNIKEFYFTIHPLLSEFQGNNVDHVVFYPNFPKVPNVKDQYAHAILHYIFGVLPDEYDDTTSKKDRLPLYENVNLTELKVVSSEKSVEVLEKYFNEMMSGKVSWSESQKDTIKFLFENFKFKITVVPVNKENMCWLIANTNVDPKDVLKTATDLLRYITALSNGDITLAENCEFKKFNRNTRKKLLSILDNLNFKNASEDMLKYKEKWIRIGEILHPGEYKNLYKRAYNLFNIIRNNLDIKTFNRELEKLLSEGKLVEASEHLKKRPGEFARKLDKLIRDSKVSEISIILKNFRECATSISIPVLLQLRSHFINRNNLGENRIFVLKGKRTKTKSIKNTLSPLPESIINNVLQTIMDAIKDIIANRDFLTSEDKVYIEPKMFDIAMPDNSNRSASGGKKILTKGSKIRLDEDVKCLRFFTHWKNINNQKGWGDSGRVDIDLAVLILNSDWGYVDELSWRSRSRSTEATKSMAFSGDITDAPNGATEYVDINISKLNEYRSIKNARYAVVTNNVYTGQAYMSIPECFSGVMYREDAGSGEIFEPSTVKTRADLCCENCGQMIAFVYDMENNYIVWMDSQLDAYNRVAGLNKGVIANTVTNVLEKHQLSVGEIYQLYAESHNILTDNPDEATFIVGRDVTEFDIETFAALL